MLIYLDNNSSVGPNSRAGQRRAKGLNENLAREMLELHTVGVDGGYSQTDVTNLARILTGWTVPGIKQSRFEPGRFAFTPARHEPGTWTVLGKAYPDRGLETGEQVIADLEVVPIDRSAALVYGSLRADLERCGKPIGANDLWIAAQAVSGDHTLVTDNQREFERVAALRWVNWLR